MSGRLPDWQRARLAELLDAFDGIPLSDTEHRVLVWLAGWEAATVHTVAELVCRARQVGAARPVDEDQADAVSVDDDIADTWIGLPGGGVRFLPPEQP